MYHFSVYHGRPNFKVLDAVASGQKTGTQDHVYELTVTRVPLWKQRIDFMSVKLEH
jgi:hypothetical protein